MPSGPPTVKPDLLANNFFSIMGSKNGKPVLREDDIEMLAKTSGLEGDQVSCHHQILSRRQSSFPLTGRKPFLLWPTVFYLYGSMAQVAQQNLFMAMTNTKVTGRRSFTSKLKTWPYHYTLTKLLTNT